MTKRIGGTRRSYDPARERVSSAIHTSSDGYIALALALFGPELEPHAWMQDAACRGTDDILWHSKNPGSATRRQRELICAGCPVMQQCAAHIEAGDELPWSPDRETYAAGQTNAERRARTLTDPPDQTDTRQTA